MAEERIPFDGFGNVIEMLKHADNGFREKILRRIASKDPQLARRLLQATNRAIAEEHGGGSESALERAQRAQNARTYGSF